MGGKSPAAPSPPPPPPSPGETSAQAIQAQIDALPKILAAQQQFGPQFSQLNLEELQKFGPEFAQAALNLQKEFGPQFAEVERGLAPELAGAQQTLATFLGGTDETEFEALKPGLLQQVRAGQSQRGLGDISPLGSIDESVQLQQLKQSLKDRRLNVALSTAGRVPIGGIPQIQGQTGTGQLVQNISPENIFQAQQGINAFNASIFGTQGGIFGNQLSNAVARRGQNIGAATNIFGSVLGSDSATLATGKALGFF